MIKENAFHKALPEIQNTVMDLMDNAIAAIDEVEGDGFALEHPQLIHAYMDAAVKLFDIGWK